MRVLIADFDLFSKIGGGQTFYRSIIEKNPNVDFYYFASLEPPDAARPANAYPITFKQKYYLRSFPASQELSLPQWICHAFVMANNTAASVAGHFFDIVDLPDYEQFGTLLRPALRYHNVGFKRIALSMHGRISTTTRLNWEGAVNRALEWQEQMQYCTVDIRYGISKTYLDEWRQIVNLESHCLDPLSVISLSTPTVAPCSSERPSINFIGRTEKGKGPDNFVELVWWLPRSIFSTANIIGPESYDSNGVSSKFYLSAMIHYRLKDIRLLPAMNQIELAKLFASKSMTFLPSRFEPFNLIALESLFSGCPTAIGSGAGVCRFLSERFPEIPFITIDIKNLYSCIPSISSILQNYDEYRQQLVDAVSRSNPEASGPSLEQIYNSTPHYDNAMRNDLNQQYFQLMNLYNAMRSPMRRRLKVFAVELIKPRISPALRRKFRAFSSKLNLANLKLIVKSKVLAGRSRDDAQTIGLMVKAYLLIGRYKNILKLSEKSEKNLNKKIKKSCELGANFHVDRIRLWREIARLELMRGNELIAATYLLRLMRLHGYDHFGDLKSVVRILEANGLGREALVAEAMYGTYPDRVERCAKLLDQALTDNKHNQKWEYEFVNDQRTLATYKVSIIVSLYNAASKLPLFLEALKLQTLIKAGIAEVILIDSGSPDEEYTVFQQKMRFKDIPIVYARSAQRETIQSAWNRGIALSRSPYLAFLGVDEVLLPHCLELLASELDADPTLDWVQGDSLVTNVDEDGQWVNDIMLYDRSGFKQDLVYLETCYLSAVGALYRRSIHDRFGFHDATFSAAGDTEFKNRVLPFIKTKCIPQTLGVFKNYPEGQTTSSPRAEIEDLRAWYLHRTLAGIKYAFAKKDPREAEDLLYSSLCYRKSYCQHLSTDIEYAYNVATFLREKVPDSPALKYIDGIKKVLDVYRSLDWMPRVSRFRLISAVLRALNITAKVRKHHQALNNQAVKPLYKILNDNRYEQHSNIWFADEREG